MHLEERLGVVFTPAVFFYQFIFIMFYLILLETITKVQIYRKHLTPSLGIMTEKLSLHPSGLAYHIPSQTVTDRQTDRHSGM